VVRIKRDFKHQGKSRVRPNNEDVGRKPLLRAKKTNGNRQAGKKQVAIGGSARFGNWEPGGGVEEGKKTPKGRSGRFSEKLHL